MDRSNDVPGSAFQDWRFPHINFGVIMRAFWNRRSTHRHSIRARLRWEGVGSHARGEGLTNNISTRGVYFLGDRRMTVGQPIQLTMALKRQSISVGGHGVVVRVEPRDGGYGVGVWLDELSPLPDAPRDDSKG